MHTSLFGIYSITQALSLLKRGDAFWTIDYSMDKNAVCVIGPCVLTEFLPCLVNPNGFISSPRVRCQINNEDKVYFLGDLTNDLRGIFTAEQEADEHFRQCAQAAWDSPTPRSKHGQTFPVEPSFQLSDIDEDDREDADEEDGYFFDDEEYLDDD